MNDEAFEAATRRLHERPCPWCGCEPEVTAYWRDSATQLRIGYTCACGARVIDGIVQGVNIG